MIFYFFFSSFFSFFFKHPRETRNLKRRQIKEDPCQSFVIKIFLFVISHFSHWINYVPFFDFVNLTTLSFSLPQFSLSSHSSGKTNFLKTKSGIKGFFSRWRMSEEKKEPKHHAKSKGKIFSVALNYAKQCI